MCSNLICVSAMPRSRKVIEISKKNRTCVGSLAYSVFKLTVYAWVRESRARVLGCFPGSSCFSFQIVVVLWRMVASGVTDSLFVHI